MVGAGLSTRGWCIAPALVGWALSAAAPTRGQERPGEEAATRAAATTGQQPRAADGKLVPIELKLPKPAFKGTPTHIPPGTNLEPPRKGVRPPVLAPAGARNVALGKPVTSSDREPVIGKLKCVTDGDKEANEGSYVELGPRLQWVQIDLKDKYAVWAIVVWHYHISARVYHDVVVQVADDPDFVENVHTVFNNDHDNSSGLGLGSDKQYWETYEGKLLNAQGVVARYVRLYSKGSTADDMNHYTEVEVFGVPAR